MRKRQLIHLLLGIMLSGCAETPRATPEAIAQSEPPASTPPAAPQSGDAV